MVMPDPGADVGWGEPSPVQMWEGASPIPGADVAGLIPSRNASHAAAAEGGRAFCLMLSPTARKCVPIDFRGSSMHSHLRAPAGPCDTHAGNLTKHNMPLQG